MSERMKVLEKGLKQAFKGNKFEGKVGKINYENGETMGGVKIGKDLSGRVGKKLNEELRK